jgi:inosine-uridine nucleoside N-ribohydrolase
MCTLSTAQRGCSEVYSIHAFALNRLQKSGVIFDFVSTFKCLLNFICSMKKTFLLAIAALAVLACATPKNEPSPVKIIFDSDFAPDYDDVGALAILHAMADSGKAEILATLVSNRYALAAPGINILNTYFGRPDLPIGAPKTHGVDLGAFQHWPDTIAKYYEHTLQSTADAPDAVSVYRKVLCAQPDTSVTIVTVGFLTNMEDLLKSGPDSISPLSGKDLVSKKVKKLVCMAGRFPSGSEFNVHMDSTASMYAFENWPTPVIFTGFEIGANIHTGLRLMKMNADHSPVKDVFAMNIPLAAEDAAGRMSWDETAVLIAVYGTERFYDTVHGRIHVNPDGSNSWTDDPAGPHVYVVQKMPVDQMADFLEDRMMHLPVHHK